MIPMSEMGLRIALLFMTVSAITVFLHYIELAKKFKTYTQPKPIIRNLTPAPSVEVIQMVYHYEVLDSFMLLQDHIDTSTSDAAYKIGKSILDKGLADIQIDSNPPTVGKDGFKPFSTRYKITVKIIKPTLTSQQQTPFV